MCDIHTDTNSKGYFVLKNCFEALVLELSDIQIQIRLRFSMVYSINTHLRLKNHPTQHECLTLYP